MKTHTHHHGTLKMFTRYAVRAAGALLATVLAGVSMAAAQAPVIVPAAAPLPSGPKAYVALVADNEVAVIATRTRQVLGYIPGILGPHDLVASPDGRTVYVGNDGVPVVSVIDTSTDSIVASIRVGFDQRGLALSPDGRDLLVSLGSADDVVIVDTATQHIRGHIDVPAPARSAVSPDGRLAYVISAPEDAAASIVVVDLATLTPTGRIPLGATPVALNVAPDGRRLYLTMADMHRIVALDVAQHRVVGRIMIPAGSRHPVPTGDGRSLVVVNTGGGGTLDVVDLTRGVVSGEVAVGRGPAWVAIGDGGHTAYVTNDNSGDVSVVDLDDHSVLTTITVGHDAGEIVVPPGPASRPL